MFLYDKENALTYTNVSFCPDRPHGRLIDDVDRTVRVKVVHGILVWLVAHKL